MTGKHSSYINDRKKITNMWFTIGNLVRQEVVN
jgi:hypothetical protein